VSERCGRDANPKSAGGPRHVSRARLGKPRRDVAERGLDEIGIAILERDVEIGGDVLLGLETVGGVPAAGPTSHVVLSSAAPLRYHID